MGEQVDISQLRCKDRIFKLEFGQIMGDWGGVPVHLAFGDQFANGGGSEGLRQGAHRLNSLEKAKCMATREYQSLVDRLRITLSSTIRKGSLCWLLAPPLKICTSSQTYLDGERISVVSFTETLRKDELALVQNSKTHSRESR